MLSFILLFSFTGYTQTPWIDSIKKVTEIQKADTNKLSNLLGLTTAFRQFNPDSSIVYAHKSLVLSENLNYQPGVFGSEVALSQALMIIGNHPLALEYAFKAQVTARKVTDTTAVSYADYMLSDCYYYLGDYQTSLLYLRKVITTVTKLHPDALYLMWSNLSRLFDAMKQPDSSLMYVRKAYTALCQSECMKTGEYESKVQISRISPLLGNAFAGKSEYDSALYYYRIGVPVSSEAYLQTDLIDDYNGIAFVYKAMRKPDSVILYAQKVLAEKITKTYPVGFLKAVDLLAATYESVNRPDSALKYMKIAIALKDSLFNKEKTIAVQNLNYKEQEKLKELSASKIKIQNRFKLYFLVAGLVVLFIIVGILIRSKRQKQLQSIRNSIADDLHDEMGSTLSSISIMSELARAKSPETSSLLQSIGESAQSLQENMSDIVWAINPKNDRFENVLQRMSQFATEILEAKNIEFEFINDARISGTRLTMGQRKNFYLFFKEVINNAAKYSDAKKVVVNISHKDRQIEMHIKDDGKGFDPGKASFGNGMSTLKKRGEELRAYLNIQSQLNAGTTVELKFKIT